MGHSTTTCFTPEELITATTPAPNGYANSKCLAEHLLAQAAKQSSLHTFARVGQIAGPRRGAAGARSGKNPAVNLLEFLKDIMSKSTRENVLDAQLIVQRSGKLQAVEAVKPEWIQKWVGELIQ
ncbi:hypothetical protein AFCA_008906 [Aspergillus flavus]|nr:hypothetical protein AFCA_008906 [Aspergillus flavus]